MGNKIEISAFPPRSWGLKKLVLPRGINMAGEIDDWVLDGELGFHLSEEEILISVGRNIDLTCGQGRAAEGKMGELMDCRLAETNNDQTQKRSEVTHVVGQGLTKLQKIGLVITTLD